MTTLILMFILIVCVVVISYQLIAFTNSSKFIAFICGIIVAASILAFLTTVSAFIA